MKGFGVDCDVFSSRATAPVHRSNTAERGGLFMCAREVIEREKTVGAAGGGRGELGMSLLRRVERKEHSSEGKRLVNIYTLAVLIYALDACRPARARVNVQLQWTRRR